MSYAANKRYRKKYPKKRKKEKRKYYRQFSGEEKNANHRELWTVNGERMITSQKGTLSDRDLHELLGRSVTAIQTRRSILKKEEEKALRN